MARCSRSNFENRHFCFRTRDISPSEGKKLIFSQWRKENSNSKHAQGGIQTRARRRNQNYEAPALPLCYLTTWISNGPVFKGMSFSYVYRYGLHHLKFRLFCSNLLDFRFHSTSRPFANQPLFDHSEFGRVQISDHTVSWNFNSRYFWSRWKLFGSVTGTSPGGWEMLV